MLGCNNCWTVVHQYSLIIFQVFYGRCLFWYFPISNLFEWKRLYKYISRWISWSSWRFVCLLSMEIDWWNSITLSVSIHFWDMLLYICLHCFRLVRYSQLMRVKFGKVLTIFSCSHSFVRVNNCSGSIRKTRYIWSFCNCLYTNYRDNSDLSKKYFNWIVVRNFQNWRHPYSVYHACR